MFHALLWLLALMYTHPLLPEMLYYLDETPKSVAVICLSIISQEYCFIQNQI